MNKSLVVAVGVAGSVGLLAALPGWAQLPQASAPARTAPARTGVALVDTGVIMKNSNRFNAAMEKLKAQMEAKGQELKKEGERGNQLTEELRALPQNDPQRKQMEQNILKMRADYELKGKRITEDIRDEESKIVLGLMAEIKGELGRYAQATGTQLILRDNPEPPNLSDPRVILQEIHKPIVYQSGIDATSLILDSLNRGTAPPPGNRAAAPGQTVPR